MVRLLWLAALAASSVAACGLFAPFDASDPRADAGRDGSVDSGGDAAGRDGALDAAEPDTGLDSAVGRDAEQPCTQVVGRLSGAELSDDANVVAVEDDRVVMGEEDFGLAVIDVSDPADPRVIREIGTIPAPAGPDDPAGKIRDIALAGDLALVTELGAGLAMVDLLAGSYELAQPVAADQGSARGVALRNDEPVVAWGDAGLVYIYVNPDGPEPWPRILGLGCGAVEVALGADHAYVACLADVRVVSLPPDDFEEVASVMVGADADDDARDLVTDADGTHVWVAVDPVGLVVVSIDDPVGPVVTGVAASASVEGPKHIARWGDFAVVAGVSRLEVFDVSEPDAPVLAASYLPVAPARVGGVAVGGDLAYVAAGEGGLEILDLTCLVP